jgi:hypothetical protein
VLVPGTLRNSNTGSRANYGPGERNRRLLDTPSQGTLDILQHPRHRDNAILVSVLVETLQACRSPQDLYDLQSVLAQHIYSADEWRGQCAEIELRLRRGAEADSSCRQVDWELERMVADRIARQLRCVGDGLAWKALGYHRRLIMALGSNRSQANVYRKDGFWCELTVVREVWKREGHLALHHDLTSCLRVSDLTECTSLHRPDVDPGHSCGPETHLLHEVKNRNGTCVTHHGGAQLRRAQAVIDSVNSGAPIIGDDGKAREQFISSLKYKTHLADVVPILEEAWKTGYAVGVIESGRVVSAAAPLTLLAKGVDLAVPRARLEQALGESGVAEGQHRFEAPMVDALSITTGHPPLSIYPFTPDVCAAMICDYLTVLPILSADAILAAMAAAGFEYVGLPPKFELSKPDAACAWGAVGGRQMAINSGGLVQILYEFLDVRRQAEAMVEYCSNPDTVLATGILVLHDEASTWV